MPKKYSFPHFHSPAFSSFSSFSTHSSTPSHTILLMVAVDDFSSPDDGLIDEQKNDYAGTFVVEAIPPA
jgi:hypothetical protein